MDFRTFFCRVIQFISESTLFSPSQFCLSTFQLAQVIFYIDLDIILGFNFSFYSCITYQLSSYTLVYPPFSFGASWVSLFVILNISCLLLIFSFMVLGYIGSLVYHSSCSSRLVGHLDGTDTGLVTYAAIFGGNLTTTSSILAPH